MKFFTIKSVAASLVALLCVTGMTSCSDDDEPIEITVKLNETAIEYDSEGVWTEVGTNNFIQSQYLVFSHYGEIGEWGLVHSGFTPARCSNTEKAANMLDIQFSVISGGGMSGKGTPYFLAYWNTMESDQTDVESRSCRIYYAESITSTPKPFSPKSVYVNNACYTYYSMLEGDMYAKKFEEGDFLTLIAHGVHADGTESTAEFKLADCSKENEEEWFVTDWTAFNLSGLGEVTEIYFTMESSDVQAWGMNTPAYFCIDRLSIVAPLPQY